jgi:hypothetical protein
MNIIDLLINLILFCLQNFLLPLLANDNSLYPLETFTNDLAGIQSALISLFSGWGTLAPIEVILIILIVVLISELALFGFKIIKYAINLFRGSGA